MRRQRRSKYCEYNPILRHDSHFGRTNPIGCGEAQGLPRLPPRIHQTPTAPPKKANQDRGGARGGRMPSSRKAKGPVRCTGLIAADTV
jgi:hypothetical protein